MGPTRIEYALPLRDTCRTLDPPWLGDWSLCRYLDQSVRWPIRRKVVWRASKMIAGKHDERRVKIFVLESLHASHRFRRKKNCMSQSYTEIIWWKKISNTSGLSALRQWLLPQRAAVRPLNSMWPRCGDIAFENTSFEKSGTLSLFETSRASMIK